MIGPMNHFHSGSRDIPESRNYQKNIRNKRVRSQIHLKTTESEYVFEQSM